MSSASRNYTLLTLCWVTSISAQLRCLNTRTNGLWTSGPSEQWTVGPEDCRTNELSEQWTVWIFNVCGCCTSSYCFSVDLSDQWTTVGPMDCRTNGLSDQWTVGPMNCRTSGLTPTSALSLTQRRRAAFSTDKFHRVFLIYSRQVELMGIDQSQTGKWFQMLWELTGGSPRRAKQHTVAIISRKPPCVQYSVCELGNAAACIGVNCMHVRHTIM